MSSDTNAREETHWFACGYHWQAFSARFTPAFWEFFLTNWWIFVMQIMFEEMVLLWSRWYKKDCMWSFRILCSDLINLVYSSKRKFHELYYFNRSGLAEKINFSLCRHKKKKRIGEQSNYFWDIKIMKENKGKFSIDRKSRGPLLASSHVF